MKINTFISPGELIDKITILEIKSERITDSAKLKNVEAELSILRGSLAENVNQTAKLADLIAQLKAVNEKLWVIEDDIRDKERSKDFGDGFVQLARAVYFTNDERARIKNSISLLLDSAIIEEKSYAAY